MSAETKKRIRYKTYTFRLARPRRLSDVRAVSEEEARDILLTQLLIFMTKKDKQMDALETAFDNAKNARKMKAAAEYSRKHCERTKAGIAAVKRRKADLT
jgi:hypothetical protein